MSKTWFINTAHPGSESSYLYTARDDKEKRSTSGTNRKSVEVPYLDAIMTLQDRSLKEKVAAELDGIVRAAFELGLKDQRRRDREKRKT